MSHTLLYLEREPRLASPSPPLLFLMHGRAAEAKVIFSIEGLLDPRLHIVAIQAPFASQLGGFEWFRPSDEDKNARDAIERDEQSDAYRLREPEDILTQEIQAHIEERKLQSSKLFLGGFSQGAAMCYMLGLRGIIKPMGVIPMSGFLPSPVRSWTSFNTSAHYLITHGTNDEVLPPKSSIDAQDFLVSKNIEVEYFEYPGRHKLSMKAIEHVNGWIGKQI